MTSIILETTLLSQGSRRGLLDHPNSLAIQALCEASVALVAAGVAMWKWQVVAASGGPLIALLGLLGR